ncbi:hypothetical protein AVEN_249438-1 [Araneus ventricosus]|uniref:Uncharacterized protein n=1 Tax=Araneus ventricosus TaxID=182803 RepID=A0A4Y2RFU9_ARAVE|nr:hypothetical protein AVEN_249438-1 [Araneus ventricosus]
MKHSNHEDGNRGLSMVARKMVRHPYEDGVRKLHAIIAAIQNRGLADVVEDPIKWLKENDRVAEFNKVDDMMCLANSYFFLDGTAKQWYVNHEDVLNSWEAFKTGISELFGDRQKIPERLRNS